MTITRTGFLDRMLLSRLCHLLVVLLACAIVPNALSQETGDQPEQDQPNEYIEGEPPPAPTTNSKNIVDWGPRNGIWRGQITLPEEQVLSFNFVTKFHRDRAGEPFWTIDLRNGTETIPASIENNNPSYTITFDGTSARIEATLNSTTTGLSGEYIYTRKGDAGADVEYRLPFSAEVSDIRRFDWIEPLDAEEDQDETEPATLEERWSVTFDEREGPAVAEFRTLPDGLNVYGTVMLPTGDDGHLAGSFENGRLRLSRFTGGSGLLYDATLEPDGRLIGTFRSLAHHAEGFTATPDGDAALPNLFNLTKWNSGVELADLTFRDVNGSDVNLASLAPKGSAQLIYVMGTWCHNCADATRYLRELSDRYAERGLTITGLAFEVAKDFDGQASAVRNYVQARDVPFPILVAGQRDKQDATKTLRALDKIAAYPTVVFIDKEGRVTAVHQSFVGPAAPGRHAQLRREFESRIESMLASE